MIQRIQSVWLFFATAAIFSMFLFPYTQFFDNGSAKVIKVTGVYAGLNGQVVQTQAFTLFTIATVIVALIPFILIFLYKNRKRQMTFSYLTILVLFAHSFWLSRLAKPVVGDTTLEIGNYSIGAILPSIAIIFILMAIRGIRKDEKLIKSTDRLR